ncbi:hypothetical protein TNCV_1615391 [Trichonephila clavipes]|nr:hypothetical protein TNCV_1615391 [Trichonephila clavipes]
MQQSFLSSGSLSSHLSFETKEKPPVCEICYKAFSNRGNLKEHLRIHTNEKTHVCEICKAFTQRGALTVHLRIHTNEKPHICEICIRSNLWDAQLAIPDMLDWRQIWGSGRPRKGSNSAETVFDILVVRGRTLSC